jgi:hypothetical protein
MKLQILREGQEGIVNYEHTTVSRNEIDISHIINNECEQILATDVLDDFNTDAMPELIHALVSKLRMGGELSLGGTDIRLLCKSILNGLVTESEASELISSINSASSLVSVQELLMQTRLQIIDTHMNGVHFEIKARRV